MSSVNVQPSELEYETKVIWFYVCTTGTQQAATSSFDCLKRGVSELVDLNVLRYTYVTHDVMEWANVSRWTYLKEVWVEQPLPQIPALKSCFSLQESKWGKIQIDPHRQPDVLHQAAACQRRSGMSLWDGLWRGNQCIIVMTQTWLSRLFILFPFFISVF